MITLQHIISDVRNITSSSGNSDDSKASDEMIAYWANEIRSLLISQAIAKRDTISDTWIMNIPCFELEMADISDCCSVPTGCYGLRSVLDVPRTIETDSANLIIGVYTSDGEVIDELTKQRSRYKQYNKYTADKRGWFIKNNKLVIVSDTDLGMVNLAIIPEDPSDLENYPSCTGSPCWSFESSYPVSMKMASQITDIIVKTKMQVMMTFPMDNSNNASSATPQQAQQDKNE